MTYRPRRSTVVSVMIRYKEIGDILYPLLYTFTPQKFLPAFLLPVTGLFSWERMNTMSVLILEGLD